METNILTALLPTRALMGQAIKNMAKMKVHFVQSYAFYAFQRKFYRALYDMQCCVESCAVMSSLSVFILAEYVAIHTRSAQLGF